MRCCFLIHNLATIGSIDVILHQSPFRNSQSGALSELLDFFLARGIIHSFRNSATLVILTCIIFKMITNKLSKFIF